MKSGCVKEDEGPGSWAAAGRMTESQDNTPSFNTSAPGRTAHFQRKSNPHDPGLANHSYKCETYHIRTQKWGEMREGITSTVTPRWRKQDYAHTLLWG